MNAAGYSADAMWSGQRAAEEQTAGRKGAGRGGLSGTAVLVLQYQYWAAPVPSSLRHLTTVFLPPHPLLLPAARKIGVKAVAKSAAKRTAKGVIHSWAGTGPEGGGTGTTEAVGATGSGTTGMVGAGGSGSPGGKAQALL